MALPCCEEEAEQADNDGQDPQDEAEPFLPDATRVLLQECLRANTIIEVSSYQVLEDVDRSRLAAEAIACRLEERHDTRSRALLIAPTMLLVR